LGEDDIKCLIEAFGRIYRKVWQRLPRQSFDLIQACDVLEKAAAGLPGLQELTWPSLRAALSGLAVTDESCTPDGPLHHCGVPLRLCARLALAVVTGDRALVRVGENEIIKEASPRLEWNDAEQVLAPLEDVSANLDAGIGNILPIDTLFISARLPGGGHGRGYLRSSTAIPVQVTKADAEIAYRLRKPDGTWLNVLNIEERLYRPILAPRSWNPVNLTRFRTEQIYVYISMTLRRKGRHEQLRSWLSGIPEWSKLSSAARTSNLSAESFTGRRRHLSLLWFLRRIDQAP